MCDPSGTTDSTAPLWKRFDPMSARVASTGEPSGGSVSDAVLDSITRRLAATAEAYDRSAEFPRENFDILAKEGLIGLPVSRQYGGRGAGLAETLRVLGAVAKGEPST